jgi:hypothetical protein
MYLSSALKYSAFLDQQHLLGCRVRVLARAQPPLHLLQRLLQAFQPHRLGQVIGGLQLEGLHGVLGVGGDEDQGRRLRQLAQGLGQRQAAGAGHVDVQQRDVETLVAQ